MKEMPHQHQHQHHHHTTPGGAECGASGARRADSIYGGYTCEYEGLAHNRA